MPHPICWQVLGIFSLTVHILNISINAFSGNVSCNFKIKLTISLIDMFVLKNSVSEKGMFCCSHHTLTISTTGICGNFSCTFSAYLTISLVDTFLLHTIFPLTPHLTN